MTLMNLLTLMNLQTLVNLMTLVTLMTLVNLMTLLTLIAARVHVHSGREEGRGEGQRVNIVGVVVCKEMRLDSCLLNVLLLMLFTFRNFHGSNKLH